MMMTIFYKNSRKSQLIGQSVFDFSSLSTSGCFQQFWLELINLDDDDDDFSFKLQKKLSQVLDELERFVKKGKSSEFNFWHDETISRMLTPLEVPWRRKNRRRPQRVFIIFRIWPKWKSNLKFYVWIFLTLLFIVI